MPTMNQTASFDHKWRAWIIVNLRRRCSAEAIVTAMVKDGFDRAFAEGLVAATAMDLEFGADQLGPVPPLASGVALPGTAAGAGDPNYVREPSRIAEGNAIVVADRTVRIVARMQKPDVAVLAGLLSDDECRQLIDLARPKMERSTTVDPATGDTLVHARRTSTGTFFNLRENEFIARLDDRLAEVTRWPVARSEGLQILRYDVGGQYHPHFDYFPPADAGSGPHLAQGGQRIATIIMYLNDVEDGGESIFPTVGIAVAPRPGNAVYFSYCNSQGQVDPLTLHGGAPVRRGEKWIATKWLRQTDRQ